MKYSKGLYNGSRKILGGFFKKKDNSGMLQLRATLWAMLAKESANDRRSVVWLGIVGVTDAIGGQVWGYGAYRGRVIQV